MRDPRGYVELTEAMTDAVRHLVWTFGTWLVEKTRLPGQSSWPVLEREGAALAAELPADAEDITARVNALKTKMVRAIDAYRCCLGAKQQAQRLLLDSADKLREIWLQRRDETTVEALVTPLPPSVIRFVRYLNSPSKQLTVRLVDAVAIPGKAEVVVYEGDWPETLPEVERSAAMTRAHAETIRKTEEDCLKCVEKKVLQQSTPRKRRHLTTGELILRREPGGSKP